MRSTRSQLNRKGRSWRGFDWRRIEPHHERQPDQESDHPNLTPPSVRGSIGHFVRRGVPVRYKTILRTVALAVATSTCITVGSFTAGESSPAHAAPCPVLQVYGVQGTGQSAPDSPPDLDTGFLSQVLGPLNDGKSGHLINRKYIPYEAGFGGAVAGGSAPYSESVAGAVTTGRTWVNTLAMQCPDTRFAFVGYSQGAHAVRMLVNDIMTGQGMRLGSDRIAAVATFGDPTRPAGAALFPGAPQQVTPSPVPGTSGQQVRSVVAGPAPVAEGGGIAPVRDSEVDLTPIAGRYASFCTPGDLACDAPSGAPITRLVTNVAGQSTLNPDDPVTSISTIANALAMTTVKTAIPVINEDFQAPAKNLESLSYQPQQTMSSRLAEASDPRTPMPTIDEGIAALWKVGTIAFNAARTVIQKVATPETIGQVVLAGATNPAAIIGVLAPKLAEAAVELVPPFTAQRWVSEAFTAFQAEFQDNKDLFSVTSAVKLFDTAAKHGSYGSVAATPSGEPPTTFVTKWLKAAAADLDSPGQESTATSVAPTSHDESQPASGIDLSYDWPAPTTSIESTQPQEQPSTAVPSASTPTAAQ